jgi:hypothetical protein
MGKLQEGKIVTFLWINIIILKQLYVTMEENNGGKTDDLTFPHTPFEAC